MYLLAKYYKTPRDPRRTGEKGYLNNPENFQWDESVNFVLKADNRDIRDNNVVLDIFGQRLVKCSISGMEELANPDFQSVFAYFYKNYQQYFDRMFQAVGLDVVNEQGERPIYENSSAEPQDRHPEPEAQPETTN
jgi:hypothetical protein